VSARVWVLLSVLLGTALLALDTRSTFFTMVDDAWITARFAEHAAEGYGFVYNVGERVEGFSNPAWAFFLAIALRLGIHADPAMLYGSLLHGLLLPGAAAGLAWALIKASGSEVKDHRVVAIAPLVVGLSPQAASMITNGLESAQWALAVTVAPTVLLLAKDKHRFWVGLLLGGLAWIRPEGAGIAAVLVAADAWLRRRSLKERSTWMLAAGAALPVVALFIWRLAAYGFVLPNTWAAKGHQGRLDVLRDNYKYLRVDGLTWPLAALGLIAACVFAPSRIILSAAAVALVAVLFSVREWMPGARLAVPLWVLMASGLAALAAVLPRRKAFVVLASTLAGVAIIWLSGVPARVAAYDDQHSARIGNPAAKAAEWLAKVVPPGSTAAMRDAGVFAYYLGTKIRVAELHPRALTVLHRGGSSSLRRLLRIPGRQELVLSDAVKTPPELVIAIVGRSFTGKYQDPEPTVLAMADYRLVARVKQHTSRHYDIYARSDITLPPVPSDVPQATVTKPGP